jgi:hypothetical protein
MKGKTKRQDWPTRLRRWGMILGSVAVLVGNLEQLLDGVKRLIGLVTGQA